MDKSKRIREYEQGETVTDHVGCQRTVKAPCAVTGNGAYLCATHGKAYRNNFEWRAHLARGKHVVGWYCFETDPPDADGIRHNMHCAEPFSPPGLDDAEVAKRARHAVQS